MTEASLRCHQHPLPFRDRGKKEKKTAQVHSGCRFLGVCVCVFRAQTQTGGGPGPQASSGEQRELE